MTPSELSIDLLLKNPHWIRNLARRLVRDDHLVDDIVQQTYVAALESPPRSPVTLSAWLNAVIRNLVNLELRGRGRRNARERTVARSEVVPPPSEALEARDLERWIAECVMAIREPYRSTLVRRYVDEWTTRQIAAADGVTEGAVRQRLHRAHEELAERLRRGDPHRRALLVLLVGWASTGDGLKPVAGVASAEAAAYVSPARELYRVPYAAGRWAAMVVTPILILLALLMVEQGRGRSGGLLARAPHDARARHATGAASGPEERSAGVSSLRRESPLARATDGAPAARGAAAVQLATLHVRDAVTGAPVAGAEVRLGAASSESRYLARGRSALDALFRPRSTETVGFTSAGGTLDVAAARLACEQIAVLAPEYFEHREVARRRGTTTHEYTVRLEPAARARVRVLLGPGRRPAGGAVWCVVDADGAERSGATDDAGSFEYLYDRAALALRIAAAGCATIQVPAELPEQEVVLAAGQPCRGTVVDALGRPREGCRVEVRTSTWSGPPWVTFTEADGGFETLCVAAGGWLEVDVLHDELGAIHVARAEPWTGTRALEFVAGTDVVGTVRGPGGERIAGACVRLLPGGEGFYSRDLAAATTDGAGGFRIAPVAPGDYVLSAECPGFAPTFVPVSREALAARIPVDVMLDAGSAVEGYVTTIGGAPAASVRVQLGWVCGDELRGPVAESDATGRFCFSNVPRATPSLCSAIRDRRWSFLLSDGDATRRVPADTLLLEVMRPHELVLTGSGEVPWARSLGSRNTARVDALDARLELVVRDTPAAAAPLLDLVDAAGRPVRTLTNLVIVPPADPRGETDIVFGGLTGNPALLNDAGQLAGCLVCVVSERYAVGLVEVDRAVDAWPLRLALYEREHPAPVLALASDVGQPVFAAPFLGHREPFAALYIGMTNAQGELAVGELPPGSYRIGIPRDRAGIDVAGRRAFTVALAASEIQFLGEIQLGEEPGARFVLGH